MTSKVCWSCHKEGRVYTLGIEICDDCHRRIEKEHEKGMSNLNTKIPNFYPDEL